MAIFSKKSNGKRPDRADEQAKVILDESLAAGEIDVVRRSAHSLKGTLAAFNAQPAQAMAAAIEIAAVQGALHGQEQTVRELHEAVHTLVVALRASAHTLS